MKILNHSMRAFFSFFLLLLLSGCTDFGYYWHMTRGHLAIMSKRADIVDLLENPALDPGLKQRLQLVQEIRQFSIDVLSLPDSGSYTRYVQLDRPYALQNLFAAPEFSIQLHSWCYPVIGCASYRGYYDEEMLADYIAGLKQQNFDIHVGKVPAYSTLGWFDDPVLSSFIDWPDYRLAGLLFHELTHQRVYIDNDTQFNESLAAAVQQAGTELWLKSRSEDTELKQFHRWIEYRRQIVRLIGRTRERLAQLYQSDAPEAIKREQKQAIFSTARVNHAAIANRLNFQGGFTHWFAGDLNNAKLASVSTYTSLLPAFLAMIEAHDHDFDRFFDTVEKIGDLSREIREPCLLLWAEGTMIDDDRCRQGTPR
ncbi:MAG: aminopeptidase [Gammaproteobacteria bacterium]